LREPGEGIEIDLVSGDARPQSVSLALSESIGFGGQNAALVFSAV
jgi:3-oxoacyl-(acyl-carrier-protein) synthase